MSQPIDQLLRNRGIQPSAQRVAIAEVVLATSAHPSADQVWEAVKQRLPIVSRATVYNTLHLFVEHGLLRELLLAEGCVVYDPKIERHHHFIDEQSGAILDVPWEAVEIRGVDELREFQINEYQVVMRGRAAPPKRSGARRSRPT
jgi:Fur family transcriptional regulator, iron response regulator